MSDFEDRMRDHVARLTPEQVAPFADVMTRRTRRRQRRRAVTAVGAAAAVVAVVGGASLAGRGDDRVTHSDPSTTSTAPTGSGTTRPEPTYEPGERPPPVVARLAERDVSLTPWSYCWMGSGRGGKCVDGSPGKASDLDDIGTPDDVELWFGVDDWDFEATFAEIGVDCPRRFTVTADPTGRRTFRLDPAGPAGRYQVDLFGRGDGGSVSASFVWTTPKNGPVEQPAGTIALVDDSDKELTSYGLELGVRDLGFQPRRATAEVTATAANGRSTTLTAKRDDIGDRCYEYGSLFFRGDDAAAQAAAKLGPAPYTYAVVLTLDGKEYIGRATWPRDEVKDEAPYTTLTFDPPLPAFGG